MPKEADLTAYPRPNVAVDVAVLTALLRRTSDGGPGTLAVLVEDRDAAPPGRALPGRFLRERQTLTECVADVLRIKAGLEDVRVEPRLIKVFDDPTRDPRAWTLSLAHALVLPAQRLEGATGQLEGIALDGGLQSGESLLFDHDAIVREAAATMRERYELLPDPDSLLDDPFTIAQLRTVHEAVLGEHLLKDTFRRRMEPNLQPVIEPEGRPMLRSDGGRPAQVYVRSQDRELSPTAQRQLLLPRAHTSVRLR
jgi:8-oxo-dGTP diphosphatase